MYTGGIGSSEMRSSPIAPRRAASVIQPEALAFPYSRSPARAGSMTIRGTARKRDSRAELTVPFVGKLLALVRPADDVAVRKVVRVMQFPIKANEDTHQP